MREIPGYSKKCTKCFEVKLDEEFDFQVKNPNKRYAWCNDCRALETISPIDYINKAKVANDIKVMKAKAKELRKLDDGQVAVAKQLREQGMSLAEIAKEFGVSHNTISKVTTRGYKV